MGNNNTREVRRPDTPSTHGSRNTNSALGPLASHFDQDQSQGSSSRSGRGRSDLLFLGLNSASNAPPERRETKQEREARKLEKERQARVRERERSLKEESVDGGYLVTMGVYTGPEDFNKAIVRQLIIERRMAPFWRGLSEFSESWNENQLIAAARGHSIPDKDIPLGKLPAENEIGDLTAHPDQSSYFPKSPTTNFPTSDTPTSPSTPNHTFLGAAPSSPISLSSLNQPSSQIRPRSKTLASITNTSQLSSSSEIVPREIHLPKDPYINGKAIEIFLYKDAIDCPICFLSYPPYLNKTRCCDQPVCSECFVQIKRPDPHPPEHHDPSDQTPLNHMAEAVALVSEPACCPYCQQPEFGITYEPPMFRRGLCFANSAHAISGSFSESLLSPGLSTGFGTTGSSSHLPQKRRTTSISANSSMVITTDKIRPDWATKLANARSYLARSSAAATALHTAAYLMGNNNPDTRGFAFRANRLARIRGASASASSASNQPANDSSNPTPSDNLLHSPRNSSRHELNSPRNRMQDIEELMMMEAIRLSIAAEEERKKKAEKEAIKEVKRKAKEDKKREKKERKSFYGGIGSSASGSGSALNLSLPGLGRGRVNSVATASHQEVASDGPQGSNYKGKGIDNRPASFSNCSAPIDFSQSKNIINWNPSGGAQFPYQNSLPTSDTNLGVSPTTRAPHPCVKSDTSSPTSSFDESTFDSFNKDFRENGSSRLGSISAPGKTATYSNEVSNNDKNSTDAHESSSTFNFRSLAAMMLDEQDGMYGKSSSGVNVEDLKNSQISSKSCQDKNLRNKAEELLRVQRLSTDYPVPTVSNKTPEVIITPGSPDAAIEEDENRLKFGKKPG